MQPAEQDLTLSELKPRRRMTLDIARVTPGNITLLEALDLSEAAGIDPEDFVSTLKSKRSKKQGLLLYALAWIIARREEPSLTFEEVCTYHLTVTGEAPSDAELEAQQKRAAAITGVAMLAGVSTREAEGMTVAEVAAVTTITKARRRHSYRRK